MHAYQACDGLPIDSVNAPTNHTSIRKQIGPRFCRLKSAALLRRTAPRSHCGRTVTREAGLSSRAQSLDDGDVSESRVPDADDTLQRSTLQVSLATESRRVALISALSHVGAAMLNQTEAAAFPSPSLETLQESVASSSRTGGDTGISALRNPAIYKSVHLILHSSNHFPPLSSKEHQLVAHVRDSMLIVRKPCSRYLILLYREKSAAWQY